MSVQSVCFLVRIGNLILPPSYKNYRISCYRGDKRNKDTGVTLLLEPSTTRFGGQSFWMAKSLQLRLTHRRPCCYFCLWTDRKSLLLTMCCGLAPHRSVLAPNDNKEQEEKETRRQRDQGREECAQSSRSVNLRYPSRRPFRRKFRFFDFSGSSTTSSTSSI